MIVLALAGCVRLPTVDEVDWDGDGVSGARDCDDADPAAWAGAPEVVGDGVDQDCDGKESCRTDADGDGFGTLEPRTSADLDCDDAGEATSGADLDCDDTDDTIPPGAPEVDADEVDQDCNGRERCFVDEDGDGARTPQLHDRPEDDADCADPGEARRDAVVDCDDADGDAFPGAAERIDDGVDQDCDGRESCYVDADRDGAHGPIVDDSDSLACAGPTDGQADTPLDCDDGDSDVFPGAREVPDDGVDQDCDGAELCFHDGDGDSARDAVATPSSDLTCDGEGEAPRTAPEDCDDTDPAAYPGAPEVAEDAVDQDCDGGDACHADADGDGARSAAAFASADLDCLDAGEARIQWPVDCDETDAAVRPGARERVDDGLDQDCDGIELCFADRDGDGARDPAGRTPSDDLACDGREEAPGDAPVDCDDLDPRRTPETPERLDVGDSNCDDDDTLRVEDAREVFVGRPDGHRWGASLTICDVDGDGDEDVAYTGLGSSAALNSFQLQGHTILRGRSGGIRSVACGRGPASDRVFVGSLGSVWVGPTSLPFDVPGTSIDDLERLPFPGSVACDGADRWCAPEVRFVGELAAGVPGVAVVAPAADALGTDSGAVYLYTYDPTGAVVLAATVTGDAATPGFGSDAASAGGTLWVGDVAGSRVWSFADPLSPGAPSEVLTGAPGGEVGRLVRAGDVDGDGIGDLIVGDPAGDDHHGALWLLPGGCGWSGPIQDRACGDRRPTLLSARGTGFGNTATIGGPRTVEVGDLDLDGVDDLVVGVPDYDSDTGAVWVVLGGPDRFDGGTHRLSDEVLAGRAIRIRGDDGQDGAFGSAVSPPFASNGRRCIAIVLRGAHNVPQRRTFTIRRT